MKWIFIIGGGLLVLGGGALVFFFNMLRERDYDVSSAWSPLLQTQPMLMREQALVATGDGLTLADPNPAWPEAQRVPSGTAIRFRRIVVNNKPLPGLMRLVVYGDALLPGRNPAAFAYAWVPARGYMDTGGAPNELVRAPWQTPDEPTVRYSVPVELHDKP